MTIAEFQGAYRWLSNFWYLPYGTTIEHLFQAEKAMNEQDKIYILTATKPWIAKARAREIKDLGRQRPDWNEVSIEIMLNLLRERKFPVGAELTKRLLATGDQVLIEGNHWHDVWWGKCGCSQHRGAGENHLGRLLMQVRQERRN